MAVTLAFNFDTNAEAADFLAKLNDEDWPHTTPGQTAHRERKAEASNDPPWNDAAPSTSNSADPDTSDDSDPWASTAKAKPARSQVDTSKLFPASGEHEKDTTAGMRTWTFGVAGAPECDCGYPAAKVTGKGSNGKMFGRWSCPVAFGPSWKDKCEFSEFTR